MMTGRSARLLIASIAVVALAIRAWVAFGSGANWNNSDTVDYFGMADAIVTGRPYSYFPNGYPLLIAATKVLMRPDAIAPSLIALNVLLSSLAVLLIGLLGVAAFSPAVGVGAAVLLAGWPNQINYARQLVSDSCATFLVVAAIYSVVRRRDLAAGALSSAAIMMRSSLAPVVPLVAAWLWMRRRRGTGAFVLGALLIAGADFGMSRAGVIAPPANLGINLLLATRLPPESGRIYSQQQFTGDELAHPVATYLEQVRQSPLQFVKLRARSLWDLWGPWPDRGGAEHPRSIVTRLIIGLRFALIVLAIWALLCGTTVPEAWLMAVPIVAVTAVHTLFFSDPRYTLPAEPFALLLTARAFDDGPSAFGAGLKRLFDLLVAGAGLLVFAPVAALIAAAIKLEDGGPVFFTQERVGKDCAVFRAFKFRSMIVDAEKHTGAVQAVENDPRVTRVGRILRATAFDELPQLWNIFRGDMSVVGPRPLRPGESDTTADGVHLPLSAIPGYEARHRVRPGLTGVAQVYAPRDLPRNGKFRYDLLYLRRAGLWLDLRLILQSFWITARGRWEHRGRKV